MLSAGHLEDQVAVGQAEDQVLALLAEGDLGLALLDDGRPVVGVDDLVSDLERHRTQTPLVDRVGAGARAHEVPCRVLSRGCRDGPRHRSTMASHFTRPATLIRSARRCWPRPGGPGRHGCGGPWRRRCPRPTRARRPRPARISGSEPKRSHQALDERLGQRLGQPVQQPVPVRGQLGVSWSSEPGRLSAATTLGRSIRASGDSDRRWATPRLVGVVAQHEPQALVDPGAELLGLEVDQPAVGAQLDEVALDLLGDPAHHLAGLEHGDDVAHRDGVLHLEAGQRRPARRRSGRGSAAGWPAPGSSGRSASRPTASCACGRCGRRRWWPWPRRRRSPARRWSGPPARPCGGGCRSPRWRWWPWAPGARWPGRSARRRRPG